MKFLLITGAKYATCSYTRMLNWTSTDALTHCNQKYAQTQKICKSGLSLYDLRLFNADPIILVFTMLTSIYWGSRLSRPHWTLINHWQSQALIRWSRLLVYYHLVNSNQIAIGNKNTSAYVIDVRMNRTMIR